MSWDDEDFDVPTSKPAVASWEDDIVDDEPLLDSWDVDEDEEELKKKEAEAKKKADALKKTVPGKGKKAAAKSQPSRKILLDIDKADEKTRAELLRKAELSSDLKNASDLFGDLSVGDDEDFDLNAHPRERAAKLAAAQAASSPAAKLTRDTPLDVHPLFQAESKQDYEKLRKALSTTLTDLSKESLLNYTSSLAIDLIRDLTKPMTLESARKVIVIREKERAEREARLKKSGGTSIGGAGKKKAKPVVKTAQPSFKKDMDDYGDDDFGDDDFM
ncbi:Translation initiation factor 3 subunit J component [Yamadazyma tenuis]|uniref:Translation initiation factor 3 subunit J component n=1 Tax=Candida tenuis TaxID=2315449 RepID=UPI00279F7AD7|nr:Translation initiation factor 3 subunit J component [Yamadazyma tenuis]